MESQVYSRKISNEEEKENYVMVFKDKLSFFPTAGRTFELYQGPALKRVKVESYRCTCRGPELPHEHYFIPWKGLKAGDTVIIRKDPKKAAGYTLQLRSSEGQAELCG